MNRLEHEKVLERMITDRSVRIATTRQSHYWFFSVYFPDYVKYQTADFQKEIFGITEDDAVRLGVVVAFRGSSKSTIVTMSYPIWAITGRQQKKFVLIISQTQYQARLHLANIKRELEDNQLLKKELGPFEESTDEWGATSLVIPKFNARIMIASVDQSVRGVRHGAHRPDLIICDDVEDICSVKTKEGRNKTHSWFLGEIVPLGDKNTKIIVVGNLLHEDSLLMRLKAGIESGERDGIYRAYPLIDQEGRILWRGKFPNTEDVDAERKKIGNENTWQREYMLRIIPDDGQVIYPEWIRYYDALPVMRPSYVITGIDLAISKKDTADYTAMVSILVYRKDDGKYLLYILPNPINERISFPETVEKIRQLDLSMKKISFWNKLYIENVGYQDALIQQLKTNGIYAQGVNPMGSDKRSRLAIVSPLVFDGTIVFPRQGAEHLIQQLVGFGKEKHDDLADAFVIAVLQASVISRKSVGVIFA